MNSTVLTVGRLDGLTITPVSGPDGTLASLHLTVDTLPGLRVLVEAEAARELLHALTVVLGVKS